MSEIDRSTVNRDAAAFYDRMFQDWFDGIQKMWAPCVWCGGVFLAETLKETKVGATLVGPMCARCRGEKA